MARVAKTEKEKVEEKKTEVKTKTSTTKVEDKNKEVETKSTLEVELEKAKEDNLAMMQMIKELKDQMASLSISNQQSNVVIQQNENLTRTVKVTSLLNNMFNLSTEAYGRGKVFTFRRYGETKNIKFVDMQSILEHYRKDFEIGRAVLGSKKDYEDLQLGYIYDEVLSTDRMNSVIELKSDEDVDLILSLDEVMQKNIASLIADKMVKKECSYDYNRIKRLEDEGLNIQELEEMFQEEVEDK